MTNYQKLSVFAILFVFTFAGVYAQQTSGTISGVVKDETGGVLPGVELTTRNTGTEATRTVISDDEGRYRAARLAPGDYELRAELAGFQTAVLQNIGLSAGQTAVLGVTLRVGEISEQVMVSAEVALVDTTSGTVSALVDSNQIRDLPLNARSFVELAALQEGVIIPLNARRATNGDTGRRIIIAGAQAHSNAVLLDGTDTKSPRGNTPGSVTGVMLGVDTVREFQVLTSAYTAEYGRFSGGVIMATTKSGTNEIHGSLFEFHRNSALDARNHFDRDFINFAERSKTPNFIRNQFGFTLGGPVVKDQTFFFGAYEGLRDRLTTTDISEFPDALAHQGFLPQPTSRGRPAPCNKDIFGNDEAAVVNGLCFYGVEPKVQPYLDLYPLPNGPDLGNGTAQHLYPNVQPTDEDYFVAKVDHKLTDSDDFFVRYTFDNAENRNTQQTSRHGRLETSRYQWLTLEEKHVFSPSLLNELRFAYTRDRSSSDDFELEGQEIDRDLYFLDPSRAEALGFNPGLGLLSTRGGISQMGTSTNVPSLKIQNSFQTYNNVIWTKGSHSMKMGVAWTRFQFNHIGAARINGSYSHDGLEEFMRAEFTQASYHFGNLEDGTEMMAGMRQNLFGFYMQDDVQVTPNLNLNLGVRYEFITSPTEVNNRLSNLDHPLQKTVRLGNPYFENPSLKNFSPRFGFAWDPTGSGKFSVRGGFGLFHQQILQWAYISSIFRATPYAIRTLLEENVHEPGFCGTELTNNVPCKGVFLQDFPKGLRALDKDHPAVLFPPMNPTQKPNQPYIQQWSLTLQREITSSTVVTATYAGSRGVKLTRPGDTNIPTQTFIGPVGPYTGSQWVVPCESFSGGSRPQCVAPRANSNFQALKDKTWDANSYYHALKLGLRKRFGSGFSYQLSYQWQKIIDQGTSVSGNRNEFTSDVDATSNWLDHSFDQGRSTFSIGRVLTANGTFELPFGPGRRFGASTSGFAAKLIEGWSINAIVSFSDGAPTSFEGASRITCSFCNTGRMRPQLKVGEEISPITEDPNQWYGPNSIFTLPAIINLADGTPCDTRNAAPFSCAGTYTNVGGTVGRTAVNGPGAATLDFAIHKGFSVGETANIQFRAEFFNIMNRSNFGTPRINALSPSGSNRCCTRTFGLVENTATTSRQIQLALKVLF